MSYISLDPTKIHETTLSLSRRIEERFPTSSLYKVSLELIGISQRALQYQTNPTVLLSILRISILLGTTMTLAGAIWFFHYLTLQNPPSNWSESLQAVEAAANDIVVMGVTLFFLLTLENRLKRPRILRVVHELRSLAHIVDMHQLTKDPERIKLVVIDTPSSPKRVLNAEELGRYLEYCSEMLALIGKVAVLYAKDESDRTVLSAIDEVEELTTNLSRKIWQKIMILLLNK